jgi:hypothetical protein
MGTEIHKKVPGLLGFKATQTHHVLGHIPKAPEGRANHAGRLLIYLGSEKGFEPR